MNKLKKLILVNGTMGAGKTATCCELLHRLQPGVFLDGDWCWKMEPFCVTEETKKLVMDNICYMLNNFLTCTAYKNIIFCWVMHEEHIIDEIVSRLHLNEVELYKFTLIVSEDSLRERLMKDIKKGVRSLEIINKSVERLPLYISMDTIKIDVGSITAVAAAKQIADLCISKKKASE